MLLEQRSGLHASQSVPVCFMISSALSQRTMTLADFCRPSVLWPNVPPLRLHDPNVSRASNSLISRASQTQLRTFAWSKSSGPVVGEVHFHKCSTSGFDKRLKWRKNQVVTVVDHLLLSEIAQ